MAFARRQPPFWATIVGALLLISAQMFALGHLHVEVDGTALPDCTQCALAKIPLTPVADPAADVLFRILHVTLPLLPPAEPLPVHSRFHLRAREPPTT